MKEHVWWKNANMYQVWPKSFKDTNNDGIGDIKGITEKLDYLKNMDFDGIWISPFFMSPMHDNGYDVQNYYEVNPIFGTNEDFDELLQEAKKRNLKIVIDMVFNHTSEEHEWFVESKKSKENPFSDYYVWRDKPDNEITSIFGGPAWTFCEERQQYYLHLFDKTQPDLNWDNPTILEECAKILDYWHNTKGVDGFRFDVLDLIGKDIDKRIIQNGPKLHERIKMLMQKGNLTYDVLKVGECWKINVDEVVKFTKKEHEELSMVFTFKHMDAARTEAVANYDLRKLTVPQLKDYLVKLTSQIIDKGGWVAPIFENHDLSRLTDMFGDLDFWEDSSKTIALLQYCLVGTPFVYQGQEIGTKNFKGTKFEEFDDVELFRRKQEMVDSGKMKEKDFLDVVNLKGRDNGRRPIQWNNEKFHGFSSVQPWITPNSNQDHITVEQQLQDENSILNFYKKLNSLRKSDLKNYFIEGKIICNKSSDEVIDFTIKYADKPSIRYIGNFSRKAIENDISSCTEVVLSVKEYELAKNKIKLPAWSAVLIKE